MSDHEGKVDLINLNSLKIVQNITFYFLVNCDTSQKKNRVPHMTQSEKDIFFEIVVNHKDVIFNKKTDANSSSSKKNTWANISKEFNSLGLTKRSSDQLKTCFKNASAQLKKDLAADKSKAYQTGGGVYSKRVDENHLLLPLILPSVTPQPNQYDSSSEYYGENTNDLDDGTFEINLNDQVDNINTSTPLKSKSNQQPVGHCSSSSGTMMGNLPARPKLGNRKRNNNAMLKQFVDDQGDLKRKQIEADIEGKKRKGEMYEELKMYYLVKRRILESGNLLINKDLNDHVNENTT